MPPKKGRKRRARARRHGEPDDARPVAEPPAPHDEAPLRSTPSDLPKLRVRMAGFVLGVITMFFGVLNVTSGLDAGSLPVLATGVLLIALAVVLGVLSLVPERVRALLSRK